MAAHKFDASHRGRLRSDERRRIQSAETIIGFASPSPEAVAADLGCGNGYVAVPLLGKVGRLLAVDARLEMLQDIEESGMDKVIADVNHLPFRVGAFDHAFMVSVAHEFADLAEVLDGIREVVGIGGRLTIVEHQKTESPIGPPMHERIDRDDILRQCWGWKELRHMETEYYYQMELQAI
jgi:ubiquinone/menaquinone biosynthesis C-methylase UbiE